MKYDPERERFVMDIPDCCPRCGAELEVDNRYAEDCSIKTFLICSNDSCDYELDATDEFEKAEEAYNIEESYNEEEETENEEKDNDEEDPEN